MQRGFTFIEAMIAILIFALGVVVVLQVFPLAFGIEIANQRETQASLLCQEKIEEISSLTYPEIKVGVQTEDPLSPPFNKFSRETIINYLDANLEATSSDLGLKKIEVKVWWRSFFPAGGKQVKITTLIAER